MPGPAGPKSRPVSIAQEDITPTMQGQQTTDTQMCKLWTGTRHYKSPLPKENESREESKDCTSVTTNHTQTGQQETSSYTTGKRMGHIDRTGSGETALFMQTINSHNHTRKHRANNGSKHKTIKTNSRELNTKNNVKQKVGTSKGGTRPQPTTNAWSKLFVPSMKEFPAATSANWTKRSLSMPTNQQATNTTPTNEEEHMDDVLETIHIALAGERSLLRRISTENTRLVHA